MSPIEISVSIWDLADVSTRCFWAIAKISNIKRRTSVVGRPALCAWNRRDLRNRLSASWLIKRSYFAPRTSCQRLDRLIVDCLGDELAWPVSEEEVGAARVVAWKAMRRACIVKSPVETSRNDRRYTPVAGRHSRPRWKMLFLCGFSQFLFLVKTTSFSIRVWAEPIQNLSTVYC